MSASFMSVTRTVSRSMNSDCERDLPSHDVIGGGVTVEDAKHVDVGTRRTNVCLCNDGANAAAAAAALLIKLLLSATVRAITDIVLCAVVEERVEEEDIATRSLFPPCKRY